MGATYANVTLVGTSLERVRANFTGRAFVAAEADIVVLFAQADDEEPTTTAPALTVALECVALTVGVHDDDILMFEVHSRGASMGGMAIPDPMEYFGMDPEEFGDMGGLGGPAPIEPAALVAVLGRGDAARVQTALEDDFVFAGERHAAFAAALDLPVFAAGWGYRYLAEDESGFDGPPLVRLDPA